MRGEKMTKNQTEGAEQGSPPHARGKVLGIKFCHPLDGITPACAGKSFL